MGLQSNHVLGHLQRFGMIAESTPGTYVPPTTSDFIKVKDSKIAVKFPRDPRDDSNDGFDYYELITGKSDFSFSFETYAFTSNSAGTQAILCRPIAAVLGGTPASGGGGFQVALTNTQAIGTYSILRHMNAPANTQIVQEQLAGCILDEFTVKAPGNEKPTFTFSGRAMAHVGCGNITIPSDQTGATTVTVTSPQGRWVDVGSRVQFTGSSTQTNTTGFVVGGTQADTTVTIAPAHAGLTTGDKLRPFCATPTYQAGSVISHVTGSFTMDSAAFKVTAFELSVKKNYDYIVDEHGAAGMTDATPKFRDITGSFTIRAREDVVGELIRFKNFTQRALLLDIGSTSGKIWEFSLPQVELMIEGMEVPNVGVATIKVPFRALATGPGDLSALTVTQK